MKFRNILPKLMNLETISPHRLNNILAEERVTVLDVNDRQSWIKARVPAAINLDPKAYTISDLPADKASTLVFYCSNPMCRKAPNAARKAQNFGYINVKVMSAGISGWLADGLPAMGGE